MITDANTETVPGFLQNLHGAVSKLKNRLQRNYEQTYPDLRDLIRIILDEEEAKAWESSFPHLLLPDLVEAHITRLGLQPATARRDHASAVTRFSANETAQLVPAYVNC